MTRETRSQHVTHWYTPLFDILIERHDLMTAAVYGRVWRFTKMKDGVCFATLATIADDIGVSYRTAYDRIKLLCSEGYLEDLTPGLRNAPHRYRLTGKLDLVHVSETRATEAPSSAGGADEDTEAPSSARDAYPSSARDAYPSSAGGADEVTTSNCKQQQSAAVASLSDSDQQAKDALLAIGFQPTADAERYARRDPAAALGWAAYARREGLGGGFVRQRLDAGDPVPTAPSRGSTPPPGGEVFT